MQGVFQDYEVKPDPEDWNRIEKTLSKKKSRRIIPLIIWASAASLLVLLAIYTGDILIHTEKGSLHTAVNQTTSHKTSTIPDQKTKIAAAATTQPNVTEKQPTNNKPVLKTKSNKIGIIAASSYSKLNPGKGITIFDSAPGIPIVTLNDSRSNDIPVHPITPKLSQLIKYQQVSLLKNLPVANSLPKDLLAGNGSNIHFKGLSLSNSSGLIVQNSSSTPFMANSPSFATQLASNLYLSSLLSFNNTNPTIYIATLFENQSRNYLPPVTFGLNINLSLQPKWSVETGIQYTRLQSKGTVSISSSVQLATNLSYAVDENLYYIGVPIIINYTFAQKRKTSYYWSAGLSIEKGLVAKFTANPEVTIPGINPIYTHNAIKGLQYSLNSGLGFSYKFINHFELFGQPSVSYYFSSVGSKTTVYSVHPLLFNLRTGIRYTLK